MSHRISPMSLALIAHITLANNTPWLQKLLHDLGITGKTADNLAADFSKPVAVVLTIALGLIISKIGSLFISHSFKLRSLLTQKSDERKLKRALTLSHAAKNTFKTILWALILISVLKIFGINIVPVVAGATVIGAVVGFSAQNLIKDYLSGFLLILEDQLAIGDKISVLDVCGEVKTVSLRTTQLVDDNGTLWFIANGDVRKLGSLTRSSNHLDDQ
jgi:small-conductance mechanosensitive channel